MARMEGVPAGRRSPATRLSLWGIKRRLGRVSETWPIVAHRPGILRWWGVFELALGRSRTVERRLKALAEVKVSALVGCDACIDYHSADARRLGITEQQLRDLARYSQSEAFSSLERTLLDYASAMTQTPADVSDELFADMRHHFDEAQMVELTATIAQENLRSRFNRPFLIPAPGFSQGGCCALPER